MDDHVRINKEAYDRLSGEYVARTETRSPLNRRVAIRFVDHLRRAFPARQPAEISVLDVGVGSGLDLVIFHELGLQTFGIDISETMITNARVNAPATTFYLGDFLSYDFDRQFSGIYAQAFIHLFPKPDVPEIFGKFFSLVERGGLVHFSTTVHDTPWEGYEEKTDYRIRVRRYRKRWTLAETAEFLTCHQVQVHLQYEVTDPYEKRWVNFIVSR